MVKLELLSSGAEAYLYKGEFLGYDVVIKHRVPKPYRDPRLDKLIRSERTLVEAKSMLLALSMGVKVPAILYVDLDSASIIMEYIDGILLRDWLPEIGEELRYRYLETLGNYVGRLHMNDLTHGDLTTSNVMVARDGELYIIDFGLARISEDIEDKAVDIHLMIRSLESTHYRLARKLLEPFLKGYEDIVGSDHLGKVLSKVKEIRLRGRYIEERRTRRDV